MDTTETVRSDFATRLFDKLASQIRVLRQPIHKLGGIKLEQEGKVNLYMDSGVLTLDPAKISKHGQVSLV